MAGWLLDFVVEGQVRRGHGTMVNATTEEIEVLELIAVELGLSHAMSVGRILARDAEGLHHDPLHAMPTPPSRDVGTTVTGLLTPR
jgi:hypothetical protein